MGVVFDQIPNALRHEFLGIETLCVAWARHTLGKLVHEGQGSFVGDEKVEPPSTSRVGFQTVEEVAVAMLDQEAAESVAVGMYRPVGSTPRLEHRPPITGRPLQMVGRRDTDGSEIDQQSGGKGSEIGHLTYLAGGPETMFQMY